MQGRWGKFGKVEKCYSVLPNYSDLCYIRILQNNQKTLAKSYVIYPHNLETLIPASQFER